MCTYASSWVKRKSFYRKSELQMFLLWIFGGHNGGLSPFADSNGEQFCIWSEHALVALVVNKHWMIFTRYSLQFERALKNLTPNTERATKKQNAFWAGFRKKEESYYFFPDPVILINNEPSLSLNFIWTTTLSLIFLNGLSPICSWKCREKMPFEASWDIFWSLTVRGVEESKLKTQNAVCKSSTMLSSVAEANNS